MSDYFIGRDRFLCFFSCKNIKKNLLEYQVFDKTLRATFFAKKERQSQQTLFFCITGQANDGYYHTHNDSYSYLSVLCVQFCVLARLLRDLCFSR